MIVVVLPGLATALFLVSVICYRSPIGKGFGLVAILAGVDVGGPGKLKCAEYSGKLTKAVKLRVSEDRMGGGAGLSAKSVKVAYHIG